MRFASIHRWLLPQSRLDATQYPNFNRSVHRKDSYSDFVFEAAFARRVPFVTAAATAMNSMRSATPHITDTAQSLPDSKCLRSPGVGKRQSRLAATAKNVIRWRRTLGDLIPIFPQSLPDGHFTTLRSYKGRMFKTRLTSN